MEKNIFAEVEYLGTNYFGFQVQTKAKQQNTIQAEIEKALAKLFRQKIRITFAGRTDRGVHAKNQVINFKVETKIPLSNIKKALNSFLPYDIRIKRVKKVPLDFHARFSAKSKIYRYLIFYKKEPSVFWNDFAWHIDFPLDLEAMRGLSKKIIGKRDFYVFAKEAKKYKDCIRRVKGISIKKKGSLICIDIEANGFLRSMVRNIVSFLVKVGSAKLTPKSAEAVLKRKIVYSNKPAPAAGLYLLKVEYEKA